MLLNKCDIYRLKFLRLCYKKWLIVLATFNEKNTRNIYFLARAQNANLCNRAKNIRFQSIMPLKLNQVLYRAFKYYILTDYFTIFFWYFQQISSIKFSMNVIFGIVLILSTVILIFISPDALLSAMLDGGNKALALTTKMVVVYAVWLGVFEMLSQSGLAKKFASILKPLNTKLFGELPESANNFMSLNISANILGMSGATTPMGIKSIQELEKYPNTQYAIAMFFVINATSVQLIPSSVLALRTSLGSTSPSDIILPTILATLLSTIIGVLLVKIFIKKKG